MRSIIAGVLAAIALLPAWSTANAGHDEWHLAVRKDNIIRHWLKELLPVARETYEAHPRGAVVVLREIVGQVEWDRYEQWENRIYWIREPSAESISNHQISLTDFRSLEQIDAFYIRAKSIEQDDLLSAKIEHIPRDKVQVLDSDGDGRDRTILINYPTLQPGDILGWSLHTLWHATLGTSSIQVAMEYPVAHAQLRWVTGEDFGFKHLLTGFAEGQAGKTVLRKEKDLEREVALTARRVAPFIDEPFAPPTWKQTPRFFLAMNRVRQNTSYGLRWSADSSWNDVGHELDSIAEWLSKQMNTLPAFAAEIHRGTVENFIPAARAYLELRDQFLDIASPTRREKYPDFDSMIHNRSGSPIMKANLFRSVLLKLGYEDVDVLFAHDPREGEFYIQFPNAGQVTLPLVRVRLAGDERWFDFECKTCEPGALRPSLSEQTVLYVKRGTQAEDEQFWERANNSSIDWGERWRNYRVLLANARWTKFERTPGSKHSLAGWIQETARYAPSSESMVLEYGLSFRGLSPARSQLDASTSRESFVEGWLKDRFESASGVTLSAAPSATSDTTTIIARAHVPFLPDPIEDTWILPPDVVFGEPSIARWPAQRKTGFWSEHTTQRSWELRIPLPSGWTGAKLPPAQQFASDQVLYSWEFQVDGEELVSRRRLHILAGDVSDPTALAKIGETMLAIHNLETAPVVLERLPRGDSR